MIEHVRKGDFKRGFAAFARFVPFPAILANTCPHPCEKSCKRSDAGDAVRIGALEQACIDFGGPAPLWRRQGGSANRVAIGGGALSGLTAAVELAVKGREVTVFEPGSRLLEDLRPVCEDAVESDLAVLDKLEIEVRLNTPGPDPEAFDALYLPSEIAEDRITLATGRRGIFAGSQTDSTVNAIASGKHAAISIDRYLQGASLVAGREAPGPQPTRLYMNTSGVAPLAAVEPSAAGNRYTREEAVREAARCFPCNCRECVNVCEYLASYKSYPKRYIREIYNNDTIIMGAHPANQMVNSCTLCGLCAEVCPEKLNMSDVCREARQSLTAKGKMPPSAHEFALRDMNFSLSDAFHLARHQPGFDRSTAVFFPGCQLSGSSPGHVMQVYQHLMQTISDGVGLMLGCCGAPADWAARSDRFDIALRELSENWGRLGRPRLITACSACFRTLKDHLPEVPIESLWTVLEMHPLPLKNGGARSLALHDPCTTRNETAVQDSIRRLLTGLGVTIEELNGRDRSPCCGFGGLARFANAGVAEKIVKRRIGESASDFVTYCAMCRDSFARQGKRTWHILDLVFGNDSRDGGAEPAMRADPGFSLRQENRARLKTRLLREIWGENMPDGSNRLELIVVQEVMAQLESRLILLDDIRAVIERAESSGEKLRDPATGHFIAHYRPAAVTYWVEYSPSDAGFVLHNAYSHRMQVE
jgi:Fe-S oxidoreductase